MKLKIGLLMAALMFAQAYAGLQPGTTRPFAGTSLTPEQQKAALLNAAAAKTTTVAQNVTDRQQAAYNKVDEQVKNMIKIIDTKLIPEVQKAVKQGSFGWLDAASMVYQSSDLFLEAYNTGKAIKALHETSPNAPEIVKKNIKNTFKALDPLIARLENEVKQLSDSGATGTIKSLLLNKALPELKNLPDYIQKFL